MKYALAVVALLAFASSACGSGDDQPNDAPTGDGPCGADIFFTGEIVDWASTDSSFCGVAFAKLQVRDDASRMHVTAPNGRFELCLAPAATTELELIPPTEPSGCASMPGTYATPGIVIASKQVINTNQIFSIRMITTERLQQLALTLDPAKAHVFVHVAGAPKPVNIAASHDPALAFDGTAWTAGATGENVFFPNVVAGSGTTSVQVPAAIGDGSVALAAGTVTYVMVVAE